MEKNTQDIFYENKELWIKLWKKNEKYIIINGIKYQQCNLCKDNYKINPQIIFNGPMNSNILSKCIHWACVNCWHKMYDNNEYKCPWCNENLYLWMEEQQKL